MEDSFFDLVIRQDARADASTRVDDLGLLEPITRRKVEAIITDAATHGVTLMVFETYRSQLRQQLLFQQGATRLREVGVHRYGLACDIVKSIHGDPSWKGDFSLLGELARIHGLIWGGDWGDPTRRHDLVDAVHVQRCSIRQQASLFRGEWYPDEFYDPYFHT